LKEVQYNEPPQQSPILALIPKEYPVWLKTRFVSELTTTQPEQVIRGVLYAGCKLALMGGSKSFKTWAQMDIAYCVANGLLWWGMHTMMVPVIYMDFELLDYDFRWRMEQIAQAHGRGSIDAVKRIGLKNKVIADSHWDKIHELILAEQAGLTLCDPTYKLLGGRDENKAGDIAEVTAIFDRLTDATGSSLIFAQHFAKGNQSQKESIDRGAGSGVWARDADAILTMTKHVEEDCLSVEATLRSFPRIEPFVVRWVNPLFVRDKDLDPDDLKQPGNVKQKDGDSDGPYKVYKLIPPEGDFQSTIVSRAQRELHKSNRVILGWISELISSGDVERVQLDADKPKGGRPPFKLIPK
jgi:hypothetical protein